MKKLTTIAISAILTASLTGCVGWDSIATVDGGTGWFAGDYAPYYWSDWNTPQPPVFGNGPGSIRPVRPAPRPNPPTVPPAPGNNPGPNPGPNPGNNPMLPGNNTRPTAPPTTGNGPGSNPGTPSQGGFRGQK